MSDEEEWTHVISEGEYSQIWDVIHKGFLNPWHNPEKYGHAGEVKAAHRREVKKWKEALDNVR